MSTMPVETNVLDVKGLQTVFFTNSGVEAWECGVKLIRKHFYSKGEPQKNRIIVIEGAFHGRTLGALAATGQKASEPSLETLRGVL